MPENTLLVAPILSKIFAREKLEMSQLTVGEQAWVENIKAAKHAFFVVHAEAPQHFTCLEVHESTCEETITWRVEYRDSLATPPETSKRAAKAILENLGFVGPEYALPAPRNTSVQKDGWSCGIFASNWIERSLRELRGEGRAPKIGEKAFIERTNEFIEKIRAASDLPPKPTSKAKAKAEY